MKFASKDEAVRAWVNTFNEIPTSLIQTLIDHDLFDVCELTAPCRGDGVHIYSGEYKYNSGEIISDGHDEDWNYTVRIDGEADGVKVHRMNFFLVHTYVLPMHGTMWAFKDPADNMWLNNAFGDDGLRKMSECGFRIFRQDDYEYIFGIDGGGYDFYERHWIPLYDARGLRWNEGD